jgi:hypothetical protein
MAVTTIAKVAAKPAVKADDKPTVVEYKPDWTPPSAKNGETYPTLSVGVKTTYKRKNSEKEGFAGFQGGIAKWKRILGADKDGDSVLAGIFQIIYANHCTEAEKAQMIEMFSKSVTQINQFLEELATMTDATEEDEEEEELDEEEGEEEEDEEEAEEEEEEEVAVVAQPQVAAKPVAKPFELPVPKSEKHIGGSVKHYRENVYAALKPYEATLKNIPADGADDLRKMVEGKVRTAWAAAKYAAHPAVFA